MEKNRQQQETTKLWLVEGRDFETALTLHGRAQLQAKHSLVPEVDVTCACRRTTIMESSESEVAVLLECTVKITDNLYRTIDPCYKCGIRFFILVFNSIYSW